jgi:hypothetical protein
MDRLLRQVEEPAEEQVEEATSDLLHLHQQQQVERVAMVPVQLEAVETTMHANAVRTVATCAPWKCHARLVKIDFALMQCYATPHQTFWIAIMDRLLRQVEEPAEEQVEEATSDLLHLHQQQQVERVAMIPVQLVVQLVQPEAVETTMHANAVCTVATCAPWECHARLVKMDFALTQCCATLNQAC